MRGEFVGLLEALASNSAGVPACTLAGNVKLALGVVTGGGGATGTPVPDEPPPQPLIAAAMANKAPQAARARILPDHIMHFTPTN